MGSYSRGDIILYNNESWAQYVENTIEGVKLYNGLKYFYCDDDEIERAILPLALRALGFKHTINKKRDIEYYKYRTHKVSVVDNSYFVDGHQVKYTSQVQEMFNLFNLIPFRLVELRILGRKKTSNNA